MFHSKVKSHGRTRTITKNFVALEESRNSTQVRSAPIVGYSGKIVSAAIQNVVTTATVCSLGFSSAWFKAFLVLIEARWYAPIMICKKESWLIDKFFGVLLLGEKPRAGVGPKLILYMGVLQTLA